MTKSRVLRDTLTTTILNFAGKAIGYLIPLIIAAWFGVGADVDIFLYAYSIMFFLAMIFANSIENIVVPFIVEHRQKDSATLSEFIGRLFIFIAGAVSVIVLLFLLLSHYALSLMTRFSPSQLNDLRILFFEFVPFVYLVVFSSVLGGIFNAFRSFALPAISPAVRGIIAIIVIYLLRKSLGVHSIILGYTAGELARLTLYLLANAMSGLFRVRYIVTLDKSIIDIAKQMSILSFGMFVVGMNPIVDNTVASWLGAGSISIIEYTNKLSVIPLTLIANGFFVVFLSHLSDSLYVSGLGKFRSAVFVYIKPVVVVSSVVSVICGFFSRDIVRLVYGHGMMSSEAVSTISRLFVISMVGFVPYMVTQLLVRGILSLKAAKYLLYISLWKFLLNILLDVILVSYWGLDGIIIGTTLLNYLLLIITFYYFNKCVASRIELMPGTIAAQ